NRVHNSPKSRSAMAKIVIAGVDGCLGSSFLGIQDMLALTRRALEDQSKGATTAPQPFVVVAASASGSAFRSDSGVELVADTSFSEITTCDAVIVPSLAAGPTGGPPDMAPLKNTAAWLRRHHSRGALVAGCGLGVFLLGEAGLLDGRRCTTSWRHYAALKERYPRIDAAWGAQLIEDGRVVSAAGPLSWIDVILHVLRAACGDDVARVAADTTIGQTAPLKGALRSPAYSVSAFADSTSSFLQDAERAVRTAGVNLGAQELARALSTSERTLHRRLKQACGESPKTFIDRIRVETARTLLETSAKPIKELAAKAGFSDEASFRRAFRRFAGEAPSAYRSSARTRSHVKGQQFPLRKNSEVLPAILTKMFDACVNGVTLADPDLDDTPIIYANNPFVEMTGYSLDEVIGRNCRFLQNDDREQEERKRLREAIQKCEPVEVVLRNYRKDGRLFHNRLNITPLVDAQGRLLYFLGVQYDVTKEVQAALEIGDLRARLQTLS
ncbi:MAG: helix-turn-helix domain-containing protein, partial [Methylocystis sp.]|nr:helix-turn-helix domain-containing protein [Methylocystis sp.]